MPYKNREELPKNIKDNLPPHAEDIYQKAFNSAWDQYSDPKKRRDDESREEVAHKVAWAAVKKVYEKDDKTGEWRRKC